MIIINKIIIKLINLYYFLEYNLKMKSLSKLFKNSSFLKMNNQFFQLNKQINSLSYISYKSFSELGKNNDQTYTESEALEIVEAGVFEVLKGAAKCDHSKLSRAATLKDIGFDSLDQVEIVVALEEKFNINIQGK